MKLPSTDELLFTAKSFVAAMLALYLSMRIGLTRPFWAMTTVYIVASPLAGPMRSKAIYRVLGTFVSSAMVLFLIPQLVNAPELLSLAIAAWVGFCLFVSLLDRTPRSYVFMLSGYTTALIGFPAVNDPLNIFAIALARTEEITLGIVCATLVHTLVLPRSFGPTLLARLDGTLADARRWIHDALSDASAEQAQRDRRKLAGDLTEMRLLATHLPFDTSHLRWTTNAILALQDRLAAIVPVMSGVEDRLRTLHRLDAESREENLTPRWRALLQDVAAWVQAGTAAAAGRAEPLRDAIDALTPPIRRETSWSELLQVNLAMRLRSVVRACDDCRKLRHHLSAGLQGALPAEISHYSGLSARALHHDYRLAFMSALATTLAVGLCCAFWIVTGWPSAAGMPTMAAVVVCLYATQDDPTPNIKTFMYAQMKAIPLSAIYLLFLIPAVHNFESLALVTAPLFLVLGIYIARPATARQAIPMLFGITGALGLQSGAGDATIPDVVSFLNNVMPQIAGMVVAVLITRLMRTVSAARTARNVLHAGWKELAAMSSADKVPGVAEMSARMLDRIAQLTPRLAAIGAEMDMSAVDAMRDLRVGLNMTQLARFQPSLASAVPLQALLHELSAHFAHQLQRESAPPIALLHGIDAALQDVCAAQNANGQHETAAALVGIRRDLFPAAPPYQPVETHP